jgi:hypothetical protein
VDGHEQSRTRQPEFPVKQRIISELSKFERQRNSGGNLAAAIAGTGGHPGSRSMTVRRRKIYDRNGDIVGWDDPVEISGEVEATALGNDEGVTQAEMESRAEDSCETGANVEPAAEEVGYRKPPKSAQFKPGVSGNPKGRPKAPSLREMFLNVAGEKLYKKKDIELFGFDDRSRLEGAMDGLFKKAARGDAKAIQQVFEFHRAFIGEDEQASVSTADEAGS